MPIPASTTSVASRPVAVADALAAAGPCPIVVSPLRRTRETAAPLAVRWGVEPVVEPGVGELAAPVRPAPGRHDLAAQR